VSRAGLLCLVDDHKRRAEGKPGIQNPGMVTKEEICLEETFAAIKNRTPISQA
jgi:hypothetical protein